MYNVYNTNGSLIASNVGLFEAVETILTYDGHEFLIRDGVLYATPYSRNSRGYCGLRQTMVGSSAYNPERDIYEQIASNPNYWRGCYLEYALAA